MGAADTPESLTGRVNATFRRRLRCFNRRDKITRRDSCCGKAPGDSILCSNHFTQREHSKSAKMTDTGRKQQASPRFGNKAQVHEGSSTLR